MLPAQVGSPPSFLDDTGVSTHEWAGTLGEWSGPSRREQTSPPRSSCRKTRSKPTERSDEGHLRSALRVVSACLVSVLIAQSYGTRQLLQLEQGLAQDAGLNSTDMQFLSIGEHGQVGAAGHRADANDHIDVGQRAAPEPQESTLVEARFQRM